MEVITPTVFYGIYFLICALNSTAELGAWLSNYTGLFYADILTYAHHIPHVNLATLRRT